VNRVMNILAGVNIWMLSSSVITGGYLRRSEQNEVTRSLKIVILFGTMVTNDNSG
jgi:hypothetical protein